MSQHSSAKVICFMSPLDFLVTRQFLDTLQVKNLNSMSRQQNSLSRLSFLLLMLLCVATLNFCVVVEFLSLLLSFMLKLTSSCCDKEFFLEFFIHCRDLVKSVATFFLWFFSTFVATK